MSMATSKLRLSPRVDSKTPAKASVVGLRPLKERNKRSESMVKEQMLFVRQMQAAMQHTLENLDKSYFEEDFQRNEQELQKALKNSQELVVMVQVMMKIRNELAHARLDLERAVKTGTGVDIAKRRVKWLQDRLEKVLLATQTYSKLHTPPVSGHKVHKEREQISDQLWKRLTSGQKQRFTNDTHHAPEEDVTSIVDDVAKMVPHRLSLGTPQTCHPEEQKTAPQDAHTTVDVEEHNETFLTCSEDKPQEHKRKRKRKKKRSEASGVPLLQGLWSQSTLGASEDGLHSDTESDSTAEPVSETEYFDDRLSVSVPSTSHGREETELEISLLGEDVMDLLTGPTFEAVSSPTDDSHATTSDVAADKEEYKSKTPAEEQQKQQEDENIEQENEKGENTVKLDAAEQYWQSEHHKFLWSEYMQSLDPRSWHALGLCVAETFLPKEKPTFVPELPWREKPMKVTSVIDVHKIALDRLLVRLHRMYEAISQATQATVDPIPRDDERTATVMGTLELVDAASPANERAILLSQESSGAAKRDVSLPPITNTSSTQRVASVSTENPSPQIEPAKARSSDQKSRKVFPQESTVWCQDFESGHHMPRIVKTKPKIPKKASNVLPRYLPRKIESPTRSSLLGERDTGASIWKPSMVMKIVTTVKNFQSETIEREKSGMLDHNGPKWKRIQTLLSEEGMLNANAYIATEAAKCLGQLNCRDDLIIEGLRNTIKRNTDARLIYEASKSMILLGTWDPFAMKVVVRNIKKGNEDVVAELLYTMTRARNIAFVDKGTPEFQNLVSTLTQLVHTNDDRLAFDASVALGRLCVVQPSARKYLVSRLPSLTASEKAEALYVLIKQMNCKDGVVLDCLLEQLSTANNWKHRMEAADLFIFLGPRDVFRIKNQEVVFETLERLLWDHANKELRGKVSDVLTALGLRQRACQLVLRRLEDPSEEVRGRAVISLATLGMRGVKEMKALLDILDLDSSVYVRIQVVRAFSLLEWNDTRIIRSLREREKGEGTLAKEAGKALFKLLEQIER